MALRGKYRLAALDMDGTLLNTNHETTPGTRAVLRRAAQAGGVLALSTGRCLSELRDHLAVLDGVRYVIGENGGYLYDALERRMLYRIALSDDAVDAVLDAARACGALVQCLIDNQSCMENRPDEALRAFHIHDFAPVFRAGSIYVDDLYAMARQRRGQVGKIMAYFTCDADRTRFHRRIEGLDLAIADSIGVGLEVSPPGATKARGLERLCKHLGLTIDETMAVGDGGNDLDIMGAAGLSVAMGNAIEAVRALADVETEDCDHDGAAHAIQRYMLGEKP